MSEPARKVAINRWAEEDRPREKLAARGARALTDAELLAILIGSGSARESAVELMQRLLADCHAELAVLGNMTIDELCAYNGIGQAKAVTLLAACELGRRRQQEDHRGRRHVSASADIYGYFSASLRNLPVEECRVLLLNQRLDILGDKCVGRGGLTATVVDLRLVLREALVARAAAIALCHNHPSGSARPSAEDDRLTERLGQACRTMDLRLIDHIIVAGASYYSYADEGRL